MNILFLALTIFSLIECSYSASHHLQTFRNLTSFDKGYTCVPGTLCFEAIVESDVVEINAPVSVVWDVLVDLERYPEWNPSITRIEGDLKSIPPKIGSTLHLWVANIQPGKTIEEDHTLFELRKEQLISFGTVLGTDWIFNSKRNQIVKPLNATTTTYFSDDVFKGALVPLVMTSYGKATQQGFNDMAYALKQRAESIYSSSK